MPEGLPTVRVVITGRVQGVGYRYFAQAAANDLGIAGWVRNQSDGSVEGLGQAPKEVLERWITQLHQGPPLGRVDRISTQWDVSDKSTYHNFEVLS